MDGGSDWFGQLHIDCHLPITATVFPVLSEGELTPIHYKGVNMAICFSFLTKDSLSPELQAYLFFLRFRELKLNVGKVTA